jgi:hypothetical protein
MAILPRYQRTGVRIAAPRELDFANLREGARLGQTVAQTVDRMSEFVYKKQAEAATRQGQQAVMDRGAQTVLSDIAKKGGPKSIAQKSAYELGSRIASAEIQTEAEVEISRILDNAQNNQMPFSSVQSAILDVADGYSAAMSNIDPESAAVLRQNLLNTGAKSAQRYASWYQGEMTKAATAKKSANVDTIFNSALSQAGTTDLRTMMTQNGPVDQMADMVDGFRSSMARMGYDDSTIAAKTFELEKAVYREQTIFQFYNTDDVNAKKGIVSELYKKPLPGYTYEQTVSLANKLENDVTSLIRTEQRNISTQVSENISYAWESGEAAPIDEAKIINVFGQSDGEKIISEYNSETDFAITVGGIATSPVGHIANVQEKLLENIAKPGNTDQDVKRFETFKTAVAARNTAIENDAAGYVLANNKFLQRNFENAQQYPGSAPYYIDSMNTAFDAMGVPPVLRNYLPKQAAGDLAAQLNNMPLEEAPLALRNILGNYGESASKISTELSKAGLAPEYFVAMRYSDNASLMTEIVSSKAISMEDLKKGLSTDGKKAAVGVIDELATVSSEYSKALIDGDPTGAALNSFNQAFSIAEKIALSRVRAGEDTSSVAQSVFEQMFPHQVISSKGSGINQNYLLPQNVNSQISENALRVMMSPDLLRDSIAPLDDPRYRAAVDIELDIVDLNKSGVWINNSTGDGVVLTYRFRDQIPLPVIKPDGSYYEVKFVDMQSIAPQMDAGALEEQQINLRNTGTFQTPEQQYQQYLFPAGTN